MKTTITCLLIAAAWISFGVEKIQCLNINSHKSIVATDTLHWDTELCNQVGTFEKSKYTKLQLRNAYKLWFTYNALQINTRNVVFAPGEYYSFDSKGQLEELEKEYKAKKAEYASMKLPPGKIWSALLQNRIKDLDATYELAKLDLEAISNPKVLLKNRFTKYCTEYAEALASDNTLQLMAAWGKLKAEKHMGGYTTKNFNRYKNSLNYRMRIAAARTDLLTFGWHNCANRQIDHETPNVNYQEEFEKLFISVETECDEP
ncbi:hypothetical protein HYN59_15815 [Flavobacterium album]|uniref:Uncharacterized protein n=1 Tax=Flavobacterium album TaxID=2175091 RepID=A0A2S1R1G4_9FLAO|nr:hypothetical protein [Flavobacterium album]AWH86484.1 hypothetical protein HYN59_15815 [Flavobacterium album]